MRYYDITLNNAGRTRRWSSYPNGQYDPGALDIEFDMPIAPYGTPTGAQTITIYGIALSDLTQAYQFASTDTQETTITVSAGMKAGLPLANPAQAGVILSGQVFQSFGNWQGTDMTLDLVVLPSAYTHDNPGNFTLDWQAGQPLADALKQTLSVVFPSMPISMNIGNDILNNFHFPHYCATLEELAQLVGDYTEDAFKRRVQIAIQGGKLIVYDSTYAPAAIPIAFTDMVGQPTWIDAQVMQVQTVMRADLQIGSIIRMPQGLQNLPGIVTTGANTLPSSLKYQSAFQHDFQIIELRQIGHFRSSDSAEWCTVFNCTPVS